MIMKLTEENLCGKIFNRWKVLRFSHKVGYNKYFVCKCLDCGEEHTVYIQSVISGKSKSCGCKSRKETVRFRRVKRLVCWRKGKRFGECEPETAKQEKD